MSENPPRLPGFQMNADDTPREEARAEERSDRKPTAEKGKRARVSEARIAPTNFTEKEPVDTETNAPRTKRRTPLVLSKSETVSDTLPRGVNPAALEKARSARKSSMDRLRTKQQDSKMRTIEETPDEVADDIVDRTPKSDALVGWSGPVIPSTSYQEAIPSVEKPSDRSPEVVERITVPTPDTAETAPQPIASETVRREALGTGMNEEGLSENIATRRARLAILNEKERKTKAGSMDHDRHEREAQVLEQEIRDLENAQNVMRSEQTRAASMAAEEQARQAEIQSIKRRLDTINLKERRTKGGSSDHDTHERETLALEEQIRNLERRAHGQEGPAIERKPESKAEVRRVLEETISKAASTQETGESSAPESRVPFTGPLTAEEIALMEAEQGALHAHLAGLDTESVPPETVTSSKPKPKGRAEDIVMVNSVLTRQAMGAEKRTKKNADKMKRFGTFPADPRYGGKVETKPLEVAAPAPKKPRAERLTRQIKEDNKKRRWIFGGAGAVAGLGVGLLAFFNPFGKKEETTAVKPPERPAATRSAEEAGLKVPPVTKPNEAPPRVVVPPKKAEPAPTNMLEMKTIPAEPQESLKEEKVPAAPIGETVPPTPTPETPRPETAPVEQPRPAAPEAAVEQQSTVQIFNYGPKGKEVPYFVSTDRTAFDAAQTRAESQPEGAIVRFEYISKDPLTNAPETIRGAFLSLGNGKVSPLLQDPETGGLFTAPDPTKMSRALSAGEAAAGR